MCGKCWIFQPVLSPKVIRRLEFPGKKRGGTSPGSHWFDQSRHGVTTARHFLCQSTCT